MEGMIYMNKKRKISGLIIAVSLIALLTGCSETADFSKSGVEVSEDQTITAVIMEDFSADYYQMEELIQFVNEDIQSYNTEVGSNVVSIGDYSLDNGTITLQLAFTNYDAYNGYMPEEVFVGNLQGAYDRGYNFDRTLYVAGKDGDTIVKEDLLNMGNAKVVVITGDLCVRCPSKILYYSTGMTLLDNQTVSADTAGNYFIIYK